MEFNNGSLFSVTKYEGFEDRHYVCLHSSSLNLYHQGRVGIEVAVGAKFEGDILAFFQEKKMLLFPPFPPLFLPW